MVLGSPIVASQTPPPAAPTVELDTVVADTPVANDDDSSATQPEQTLVQRMRETTSITLFTIIFLGCFFAFKLSVAVGRPTLAGVVAMSTITQLAQLIPGRFGVTVAQTVDSYSTPFLPLLWAFLRTALIGAATCGACTGVVFGGIFAFVSEPAGSSPSSCQGLPAPTQQKLRKAPRSELESSKRFQITYIIIRIGTWAAVMAVGIVVQRLKIYNNSAGDNLEVDEVIEYPLRAVVVTLAGHVVECGLRYLRAFYNGSTKGEGGSEMEIPGQINVDEKLEVSVDSGSVLPAVDVKKGDSPV